MSRSVWQRVHDRFDPQQPARDHAFRVEREGSPAGVICETLDLPFGVPRAMLTGTVGTGKTTELFRIAEERQSKELVIFLQAIADDPQHALVEDPLVEELLVSSSLLPFPNKSEWYYPNPLLMMHVLKPSAGSTRSP